MRKQEKRAAGKSTFFNRKLVESGCTGSSNMFAEEVFTISKLPDTDKTYKPEGVHYVEGTDKVAVHFQKKGEIHLWRFTKASDFKRILVIDKVVLASGGGRFILKLLYDQTYGPLLLVLRELEFGKVQLDFDAVAEDRCVVYALDVYDMTLPEGTGR